MEAEVRDGEAIPVLVVGGGIAGLSAALFLAWHGVEVVLVERHAASSPHPRAMGFTARTLELYRAAGLGPAIPQVPRGAGQPRRVRAESLAGAWASGELAWTPAADRPAIAPHYSICTGAGIPQDRLEPIVRARAIALGAAIRPSTTLMSLAQDAEGVTAVLRAPDGGETAVRARYVIAADGHASTIRRMLGIGQHGHGLLRTVHSVLFRAPLDDYLAAGISQFDIRQPGFSAMLTTYRDGRWLLMFADDEERDDAVLHALIARAIGRPDVPVEIVATGRWALSASIADRFASGRVFLAGDAAHTLPPSRGGYGANTGIEDAHNLAWKLAAVLAGRSAPDLLATYDAERRPVAWLRHAQIFARPDYARFARPEDRAVALIDDDAMEFGQLYRSGAVCGADASLPPALRPDQWAGQPGTRAPHVWVASAGRRVSTLDLVQPGWVLLTRDERWCAVAARAAALTGIDLACRLVGGAADAVDDAPGAPLEMPIEWLAADPAGRAALEAWLPRVLAHPDYPSFKTMRLADLQALAPGEIGDAAMAAVALALQRTPMRAPPEPVDPAAFCRAFGIGPAGASLVRPDGYVAWRTAGLPARPRRTLARVLARVAFARASGRPR